MDENKTCPYYLKDKKFDIFGNLLWYKRNKKKKPVIPKINFRAGKRKSASSHHVVSRYIIIAAWRGDLFHQSWKVLLDIPNVEHHGCKKKKK